MRSTGEVLGLSASYGEAFYKAQEAAQLKLPLEGTVLISVSDRDKPEVSSRICFQNKDFVIFNGILHIHQTFDMHFLCDFPGIFFDNCHIFC